MEMRKMGNSNLTYHLMTSGKNLSIEIRIDILLKEKVDGSLLREAVNTVITWFPEFQFRPVLKNNTLYMRENTSQVPVFEEEKTTMHYFGCDDTNGYDFFVSYCEKSIHFSIFHGLADFSGAGIFAFSCLYEYGKLQGHEPEAHRMMRAGKVEMDEEERYYPYEHFAPKDIKHDFSEMKKLQKNVFDIKDELIPITEKCAYKQYVIRFKSDEMSQLCRKNRITPAIALSYVTSSAIASLYDIGNKKITAMIPVDLRSVYHTDTAMNFSDSTYIFTEKENLNASIEEELKRIKQSFREQLKKDYFDKVVVNKIAMVKSMMNLGFPIQTLAGKIDAPVTNKTKLPFTYGLSFPGSIDLPESYDAFVDNVSIDAFSGGKLTLGGYSYGEYTYLAILQRFKSAALVEEMCRKFQNLGIMVQMECQEDLRGSKLLFENIDKEGKQYKLFNPFRRSKE